MFVRPKVKVNKVFFVNVLDYVHGFSYVTSTPELGDCDAWIRVEDYRCIRPHS